MVMKKIFSAIIKLTFIILLAGCQPDDVDINTGPVFPGSIMAEGTDINTGDPVSKAIVDNDTGVPIDAVFTISFTKPVTSDAVSAVSLTQDGNPVEASITLEGESIVIDPAADLAEDTEYTITVGNDIKAVDGGILLSELTRSFKTAFVVKTIYDGQIFYMPFDDNFTEMETGTTATVVGTPGFAGEAVQGANAYAGAADSYLTFPGTELQSNAFSTSFWLKVDAVPDRAGILVMGPPDPNLPATPNNRTSGFRFFRENANGMQRFKLNIGNGTADNWFDGGANADVDPAEGEWVHFAFTVSPTHAVVYINGEVVSEGDFPGISWEGTDILSIMSGAPRFTEWGHLSDESYMDELRIFDRALAQADVQAIMQAELSVYEPMAGETLYLPFNGNYKDLVNKTDATVVGTPGFAGEGVAGDSYAGAADSYLTFPAANLTGGDEFSASFWLNINATPDRAGILVMGPPDPNLPATPNNRTAGFRFFRENVGGMQRFKLNVGDGTADTWFDGGEDADVDPATSDWVHFAFTISPTEAVVYINGEVVSQGAFTGVSWEGVDVLSVMSGAPRFTEWGHLSDLSYMDELRLFDKVLTQAEIQAIIDGN
jgi:hypothetical protein